MEIPPRSKEEQHVFNTLAHIFTGDNANVRQLTKVRNLIEQHAAQRDLSALIAVHSKQKVCQVAHRLLNNGVFASEAAARERFDTATVEPLAMPTIAKSASCAKPTPTPGEKSHDTNPPRQPNSSDSSTPECQALGKTKTVDPPTQKVLQGGSTY